MPSLRDATTNDIGSILDMLKASAADQGFADEVAVSEQDLLEDGFGASPRFHVLLAEVDGFAAGMALYFFNYSTWGSRNGIYLEDLYVKSEYRGQRIGRKLLVRLAQIAEAAGCRRFQWVVHNANTSAVRLYESVGANTLREWSLMSIKGDAISRLATSES